MARLIIFSTDPSLLVSNPVLYSSLRYKIYDLPNTLYTKPVWKSVNPRIEETVHFAALGASREFLDYLLTNALIVDLWGLQGTRFTHSVLLCNCPTRSNAAEGEEGGGRACGAEGKSRFLPGLWLRPGSSQLTGSWAAETPFLAGLSPRCRRLCPLGRLSAGCPAHR